MTERLRLRGGGGDGEACCCCPCFNKTWAGGGHAGGRGTGASVEGSAEAPVQAWAAVSAEAPVPAAVSAEAPVPAWSVWSVLSGGGGGIGASLTVS